MPAASSPRRTTSSTAAAIDGCRWDKIHGWNSNRIKLIDGKLRINTFDADISGSNNGPIENLLLQTPPTGDWTAETKMTAPLGDAWQLAGFMLFSDVDHYVKFDVVADNDPGAPKVRRVELRYENGGGLTGPGGQDIAPPASATDTWWLRLTKKGNTYTGAISADGTTWVQAPGSVTVALNNPAIGLMAFGPAQAAPIDVDFEYFKVGSADTEAPTTTHTLSPVDGSNGWHVTNPTLTLATEAGATTEYKVGDGAWTPYTAPVVLESSATVSYRSKDAAGNVEEAKTVTVKVDKAAPVTTATSTPAPGADGWISGVAKITLAATDAGSGVASTQYAIDGGDWVTYSGAVRRAVRRAHAAGALDRQRGPGGDRQGAGAEGAPGHERRRRRGRRRAGDAGADARAGGLVRHVHAGRGARVHGLDDRDRGLLGRRRHALGGRPERDEHGPPGQRLVRACRRRCRSRPARARSGRSAGPRARPTLLTWGGPVSNEQVTINLKQVVAASDALRTGAYSKTLTFTLSTTTP